MHTLFPGFRFLFTRKKLCFLQQRITHPNAPNLNSIIFLQQIFNTQSSIQGAKDVTNPFILENAALGTAVPLTTNLPFMSGSPSLSNQNSSSSMNFLQTIYNYCFEYNIAVTTRRLLFTSTHMGAGFIPPSGIKSPDIVWELVHLEPLERGSELQENQLLPEDTSLSV